MGSKPLELERSKRLMAMGQMAASLAHEIRNPLGSMELYCTLLKKDLQHSSDTFQLAEQIHAGIRVLDRIISNCLQFSRDVVPRCALEENAEKLFQDLERNVRAKAEQLEVSLLLADVGEHPIYVDSYLIGQALLNVVVNALEAVAASSLGGEREVRVLSDRRSSDQWLVQVSDTGPGIPEEHISQIFDPFYTTKRDGTGLGLAIVHSIAQAHGGLVSISSVLGGGTTLIFDFPTSNCRK